MVKSLRLNLKENSLYLKSSTMGAKSQPWSLENSTNTTTRIIISGILKCCISEISVLFMKMLVYRYKKFPSEIILICRWEGIVFWNNASSLLMSNFNARRLLMNWNEFQWRKLNKGPSINYGTKKDWVSVYGNIGCWVFEVGI